MNEAIRVAVSLPPVLLFLVALALLDSYRLVRRTAVARALGYGVLVSLACFGIATLILRNGVLSLQTYSHFVAPVVEELGKAGLVIFLVRRKRVGFMVDAAILGFATGAGFAFAENVYYLLQLASPNLFVWLVRGFGTAVMHGACTAIVGIASQALAIRLQHERPFIFLPGLAIAVAAHATFNQFVLPPMVESAVVIGAFSLLTVVVFDRSERFLRGWMEAGFGSDVEMLAMLRSGELDDTPIGVTLRSLHDRFPAEVLGDMLCYLLVIVELSIKAKGILLARQVGLPLPADPEIHDQLVELRYLEKTIGATGKRALAPFLHTSASDLWQLSMLEGEAAAAG
jgi:protease PrsW